MLKEKEFQRVENIFFQLCLSPTNLEGTGSKILTIASVLLKAVYFR